MNAAAPLQDPAARAGRLDELLASLQGELDATANPHREALRQLGINLEGWTARAYDNEPFRTWTRVLELDPDDLDARHHLAIMFHARAIDREQGKRPHEADADWTAALAHWTELWRGDAFWDRLATAVCPPDSQGRIRREPIDDLRKRFPALLLRLHLDIALDAATPHHRARQHVKLALDSALPEAAKEAARKACYEAHAASMPVEVWADGLPDEALITQAIAVVKRYLDVDPQGEPALGDALQLEHRHLRVQLNQLAAAGHDDAERTRILGRVQESVQAWKPYFEHLVRRAARLDDELRRQLCLWYRLAGDVMQALDKLPDAVPLYEAGLASGAEHDPERERCRRGVPQALAAHARALAQRGDAGARAAVDAVNARADLTVRALQQIGNAYLALDALEPAEAACTRALAIEIDYGDECADDDTRARERVVELAGFIADQRKRQRASELYVQAGEHQRAGEHGKALPLLATCVELVPDGNAFHYLRARCHLAIAELGAAKADLVQYRRTMADTDEDRKFEALLEDELRTCTAEVERFGRRALLGRREALRLVGDKRFEQAAAVLRRALDGCAPAGRGELRGELSILLGQWAVVEANAAIDSADLDPAQRLSTLSKSRKRLLEAESLDPGNEPARKNREAIEQAIENVRPEAELAAAVGAGPLRQLAEARRQLADGDTRAARRTLDAARQALGPDARVALDRAWADALVSRAVAVANAAQQDGSRYTARHVEAFDEAKGLVELALVCDAKSERAAANLVAVRDALVSALRSVAAEVYNAKQYAPAEDHLRRALKTCGDAARKEVAAQLSIVLTQRAIADVNEMVERRNRMPFTIGPSLFNR